MPLGTKVLSHSLYLLQNSGVEGKRQSLYAERDAAREERERPTKQGWSRPERKKKWRREKLGTKAKISWKRVQSCKVPVDSGI
jgi:hypothetical protein